ncbi:hypothetical protein DEO72_LG7g2842 [Vigna unguiculata]|uniref:Uncharacterized protein n=1 Tax=Vigna unguiculata TaxID=3917 RepID=A0A4D6ML84_VIGUN|nr:hypothetical protein DEO72_LG7g2842 [Vigna unguiculata]
MEGQSVVVIHDASREINVRILEWSLRSLSLVPGDVLTLIAVMHQVVTPMGYKSSVDSRLMFGANQKMVEAQVARKKEQYMNNEDIARIFQQYKSEKVGFKIEMALGSSLKAVALKSALKLKATWLILDRKMKNDEEYFLKKLSCGILRVRRFNKITRLRGPLHLPHESRPSSSTNETNTESIPLPDISAEHVYLFSTETSPHSTVTDYSMNQKQPQGQKSPHDEVWYSTPDQSTERKSSEQRVNQTHEEQKASRNHGNKEKDLKPELKLKEENCDITCGGSNRERKQKEERSSSLGGAKNFFLGKAEEYTVCEQYFSLSNFHVRN